MKRAKRRTPLIAVAVLAGVCLVTPSTALAATTPRAVATGSDVTDPAEAKRVDSFDAPVTWTTCGLQPDQECAYLDVPLDYDNPAGPKIKIGAQRHKTAKAGQKKGDLWLVDDSLINTTVDVEFPENTYSQQLRENFDFVGIIPRGAFKPEYTGLQCFQDHKEQIKVSLRVSGSYPSVAADEEGYLRMAGHAAQSCSTRGLIPAAHLSIANQMRDLEVMRRLFSKEKITLVASAQGSQLAQTYAAMFPDRVRAVYVNGAVDPVHYNGGNGQHPLRSVRTNQDVAIARAMERFFTWCDKQTVTGCAFARDAKEGTAKKFADWYDAVNKRPIISPIAEMPFDGSRLMNFTHSVLRASDGPAQAANEFQEVWDFTHVAPLTREANEKITQLAAPSTRGATVMGNARVRDDKPQPTVTGTSAPQPTVTGTPAPQPTVTGAPAPRPPFPDDPDVQPVGYFNYVDTLLAGKCVEGQHLTDVKDIKDAIADVTKRSAIYGQQEAWIFATCARNHWKAVDAKQYVGSFTARPALPMLFSVSRFSADHDLASAQSAAKRTGAVLVTNEGWGVDSYVSSACVAKAADAYLIDGKLPEQNLSCEPNWKDNLPVQP